MDDSLCTIIVGIVNFFSTFVATILIDRLGRKILLYISSIFMSISLAGLSTYFFIKASSPEAVATLGWIPLACFVVFVVSFSVGLGPVPWLMMGEILPGKTLHTFTFQGCIFHLEGSNLLQTLHLPHCAVTLLVFHDGWNTRGVKRNHLNVRV